MFAKAFSHPTSFLVLTFALVILAVWAVNVMDSAPKISSSVDVHATR